MDFEKMPSRPVVSSQLAANTIVSLWQRENQKRQVRDGDGLKWDVMVRLKELPSSTELRSMAYKIKLWLQVDASIENLLESGVLETTRDSRLTEILKDTKVPLMLKPQEFTARSLEEARNMTDSAIDALAKKLAKSDLKPVKRQLIFRFVDSSMLFGPPENRL